MSQPRENVVHLMDYSRNDGMYHTICGIAQESAGSILHTGHFPRTGRYDNRLCLKCEDRLSLFAGFSEASPLQRGWKFDREILVAANNAVNKQNDILKMKMKHMRERAAEFDICLEPTIGKPAHCGKETCFKRHEPLKTKTA